MPAPTDVATVRMRAYLNLPLPERCRELAVLIDESSTTELQNVFPLLIDSIFGVTNNVGWGLHSINLRRHPQEYEILSNFLGPQGPIFSLCYKLLPDCYLKYDFPVSYLPPKIQVMLEEGIIPPFYSDKLKNDHSSRMPSALSMNPFEYYIFHFAYHLTNPWLQLQQQENVWINWETVYVQLAHSYLYHFLPRDNSPVLPIIGAYVKKIPSRKIVQLPEAKRVQTPRLLRSMVLSPSAPTSPGQGGGPHQQCLPQVWRSETVVQVFLDFWLEYTEEEKIPSQPLNSTLASSLPRRHSIHSGEHIRLVRAFIKTLHEFANSASGDRSAMDELKRIILPSVQGKIYTFLRKAIHHWPLDSSFRLILEAWLSFIQPWRYVPELSYSQQGKPPEEDRGKIHDPERWMSFVANNLLAYTSIFQQLLPRFMRTDLVAPKNALMLFRVTKVFSQPYLPQMLAEAECYMDDCNLTRNKISTKQWSAVARQQILELEGPSYQYVPMFSENTVSQIIWFLSIIKQAHLTATSIVEALEKRNTEKKFLRSLWEFFSGEEHSTDDIGLAERKRVPGFLAIAQQQIIEIFQIKVEDIPQAAIVADQEYHDSILSDSFCQSQCEGACVDDSRPGVFVPIQDERQHCRYIEYMGDPELQPVRSNECGVLVRWLYRICEMINSKYERQIEMFYNREDFVGRLTKKVLQPPTSVRQLPKRVNGGFTVGSEKKIPPRLSLRVLASYNFMTAILICVILLRLIGYGVPASLFIVSCTWIFYIVIGAIFEPLITRASPNRFTASATAFSGN
ncbi:sphingomyelin phosphodiesterase 4 [Diachasma alloeum]|uniref:sphingomyelin phosphodiesterase 4 n=1 Tax=Diachasma alloeum TaxID=454923 RepID=UPI000738433B|nr:sphingomyelin phosphodiesterase 4 [Diachasma alloeum]